MKITITLINEIGRNIDAVMIIYKINENSRIFIG